MNNSHHPAPDKTNPAKRRRAWWRWVALGLLLLGVATHAWWLRAFGEYLVAEEPLTSADAAILLGGDHRLNLAAELYHDQIVSEIWLLEHEASYAVTAGILPPGHEVEEAQLIQMGIPEHRLQLVTGGMREIDDAARMILQAARESPGKRLLILCPRTQGRNVRLALDCVSGEPSDERIAILGVPEDEFDESNWWKHRTGWKETFNASCQLLFTMICGVETDPEPVDWDPDAYERRLVSKYRGAECHAR